MTEAMPFLQKFDITFLRPPPISGGDFCLLSYNDPLDFSKNAVVDLPVEFCYTVIKQGTNAESSERSNNNGNEYRKQNP